jgi:hypothetical protein
VPLPSREASPCPFGSCWWSIWVNPTFSHWCDNTVFGVIFCFLLRDVILVWSPWGAHCEVRCRSTMAMYHVGAWSCCHVLVSESLTAGNVLLTHFVRGRWGLFWWCFLCLMFREFDV